MNPPSPIPLPRDFSDRFSPMVVKELRHGLRTRFFTVALIQFHVLLALLMSSALLGANQEIINGVFWFLALLVVLGVMPLRGFAALTSEASEGTLDMLTLTNMSALRIVYGKWAALFSQTLLVASSLLPYMVARYYFGGVEIVREAAALAVMVLGSALTTAALVAFSSQKSTLLRLLLGVGVAAAAIPLVYIVVAMVSSERNGYSIMDEFAKLSHAEQWGLIGGALVAACYGVYVFLSMGASRFAAPSENHSTVKRLIGGGVLGVIAVAGICLSVWHSDPDAAYWAFFPAMIFAILLGMDVMTEDMPRFPTVVAGFTRGSWWRQISGRLLYPGWAAGVPYYLVLCLAPLGILTAALMRTSNDEELPVVCCILTANAVPVCVPYLQRWRFGNWWVVQLVILTAGILLAILADAMDMKALGGFGIVTPILALFGSAVDYSHRESIVINGAVFGGFWLLAALVLAIREMRVYTSLEAEALACRHLELATSTDDSRP